ncbi:HAMP domain-containing histidine kinase [Acidaminobacter sp. JC074]|uniref:sensor histidine kinase n=1 Tax=Acidaminobacter sp. JC074 TaxID=2530199 RepID=UPI001F1095A9|nr:HAMP domain-containing sensor histidine kinase [Acidaminobacter sp. JC074]MCH4887301.1 HAMP domain-containing histidine kinase [Acidaminobacter sp. JC074]
MIKKSLTAKIFVFVFVLFFVQLFIQFGFQKFFLASYYENEKIKNASVSFDEAVKKFQETEDLMDQAGILYDYMNTTDEPILVFGEYGDIHQASYLTSFERTITVEIEGRSYILPFYDSVEAVAITEAGVMETIDASSLNTFDSDLIGQEAKVYGSEYNGVFEPYGMNINGIYYDVYAMISAASDIEFPQVTDEIYQADTIETLAQDENDFMHEVEKYGVVIDFKERFLSQDFQDKISDLNNYYYNDLYGMDYQNSDYNFLSADIKYDGIQYTVVSVLSLQPINEVIDIQSKFQWYLAGFMLLLILVVSYVFSKVISKPIVKISENTQAISNLDFSVVCEENRQDEIGRLGQSINILSTSLKEKIDTLEDEIEFERRQEKIRREFVADVSHELKTPLGVIRSYSEGIKDGISKEKADYYLQVIIEEVDKMNGLVLDMLELSNLESGKSLDLQTINMKRLISNILRKYEHIIPNLQVSISLEDTLVDVDVKQMEMVVQNILSNAFRYVDERNIINISLINNELLIENSHEFLKEDDMKKLWDRFYRIEKSRSRVLGGNGLGLSIVQKTLELHDFEYGIENTSLGFLFKIRF